MFNFSHQRARQFSTAAEVFNGLNDPNFSVPGRTLNQPTFGVITVPRRAESCNGEPS